MFNREPAIVFNSLGEIAKAVIPVLILGEFVHWSDKMTAAVMFLVSVSVASLASIFTRQSSVSKVVADRQIEIAKAADVTTPTDQIIQQAKESI
jgi:hypothetical protein